ncbi:2407_t:CDS:2 [Ambispora leptoticha]|uniref:Complex III subunit 9 n=1 Tax=Ambispora leptoticha TaxID=144679 RepID=A0A9N8ZXI1_9GLOM|nr:2407_t:CDS:2 [Ambispora leptoticha]
MVDISGRNSTLNRFSRIAYQGIFRRNSVFLVGIFATAFTFELVFDTVADKVWDNLNKGKQWKDIKDRYSLK